jgi:hypothetical protein
MVFLSFRPCVGLLTRKTVNEGVRASISRVEEREL